MWAAGSGDGVCVGAGVAGGSAVAAGVGRGVLPGGASAAVGAGLLPSLPHPASTAASSSPTANNARRRIARQCRIAR